MSLTIFYSWQSDSPNSTNRGFIEKALEQAIKGLGRDLELQEALRDGAIELDKDTKGIPGTPPIVEAIFNKISECGVFVPDLTFVAKADASDRLTPNPNVLIEYGWALKSVGHSRIVAVMNTAFGEPTAVNMPFDMRHLRHPITYRLEESADQETKAKVRSQLARELQHAIGLIIKERVNRSDAVAQAVYTPTQSTSDPSTFLQPGETFSSDGLARRLSILDGQRLFLRLIPSIPNPSLKTNLDVLNLARQGQLMPMQAKPGGWGWDIERNKYGAFAYAEEHSDILFFSQLFKTGEIWGIDARSLSMKVCKEYGGVDFGYFPSDHLEKVFLDTLENYLRIASGELSLALPLRFMAGATDVEGYRMTAPTGIRFNSRDPRFGGRVDARNIVFEGEILEYGKDPAAVLLPFFEYLWNECGVERPIAR
jgi:hypothetical protein